MIGFILRHKVLVVITWVVLTTVGILTLPRIGTRLDYTYTTPGQPGFEANLKITGRFGIDPVPISRHGPRRSLGRSSALPGRRRANRKRAVPRCDDRESR